MASSGGQSGAMRERIEIPIPTLNRFIRESRQLSQPLSLLPKADTDAYIIDKVVYPPGKVDKVTQRRMCYMVGWPDLPGAKVMIPCTEALDYLSPWTMEDWEYKDALRREKEEEDEFEKEIEEAKRLSLAEATKGKKKKRLGRPPGRRMQREPSPEQEEEDLEVPPSAKKASGPSLSTPQKRRYEDYLDTEEEFEDVDVDVEVGSSEFVSASYDSEAPEDRYSTDVEMAEPDVLAPSQPSSSRPFPRVSDIAIPLLKKGPSNVLTHSGGIMPARQVAAPVPSVPKETPIPPPSLWPPQSHLPANRQASTGRTLPGSTAPARYVAAVPLPVEPRETPIPLPSHLPQLSSRANGRAHAGRSSTASSSSSTNMRGVGIDTRASSSDASIGGSREAGVSTPAPASASAKIRPPRGSRTSTPATVTRPQPNPSSAARNSAVTASSPATAIVTSAAPAANAVPSKAVIQNSGSINASGSFSVPPASASNEKAKSLARAVEAQTNEGPQQEIEVGSAPADASADASTDAPADQAWEIKALEGHKLVEVDGKLVQFFLVRWEGDWPPDQNPTWEPRSHISRGAVRNYFRRKREREKKAAATPTATPGSASKKTPQPATSSRPSSALVRKYSSVTEAFEAGVAEGEADQPVFTSPIAEGPLPSSSASRNHKKQKTAQAGIGWGSGSGSGSANGGSDIGFGGADNDDPEETFKVTEDDSISSGSGPLKKTSSPSHRRNRPSSGIDLDLARHFALFTRKA